jgi:hypothetical protein
MQNPLPTSLKSLPELGKQTSRFEEPLSMVIVANGGEETMP